MRKALADTIGQQACACPAGADGRTQCLSSAILCSTRLAVALLRLTFFWFSLVLIYGSYSTYSVSLSIFLNRLLLPLDTRSLKLLLRACQAQHEWVRARLQVLQHGTSALRKSPKKVHICLCMYVCIYAYIHVYIHLCIFLMVCACMYIYTCTSTDTYIL